MNSKCDDQRGALGARGQGCGRTCQNGAGSALLLTREILSYLTYTHGACPFIDGSFVCWAGESQLLACGLASSVRTHEVFKLRCVSASSGGLLKQPWCPPHSV